MTTPKTASDELVRGLDQYAEILGCSAPTVAKLIAAHELPGRKVGNSYITTRAALLAAIVRMGERDDA